MNDVFVTSIPKSGTHLLYHVLGFSKHNGRKMPGFSIFPGAQHIIEFKKGWYAGHAPYVSSLHSNKVRIFLRRHPADIIVSWKYFLKPIGDFDKGGPFNFPYLAKKGKDVHEFKDKLDFLLTYTKPLMEQFIGWMNNDTVHKLRYEDLLDKPLEVLAPIAGEAGISLEILVDRSKFRGGPTFRTGRIGDWKDEFKPHHLKKFKQNFAEILDTFEYSSKV